MNPRAIHKALVLFMMLVSMLIPAKMGMGQGSTYNFSGYLGGNGGQGVITTAVGVKVTANGEVWTSQCLQANSFDYIKLFVNNVVITQFGQYGTAEHQFIQPWAVTGDSTTVYVSDTDNNSVKKFTRDGTFVCSFGSGLLDSPRGLKLNSQGDVVVGDRSGRLFTFDSSGTFKSVIQPVTGYYWDVVERPDGNYAIVNGDNTVVTSDKQGNVKSVIRHDYIPANHALSGVDIDSAGNLYVTDRHFGRVMKYSPLGTLITTIDLSTQIGLNPPVSTLRISVSNDGNLVYVSCDVTSRVYVYALGNELVPPTSTFSPTPTNNWSNSDVTATITSSDNVGGSGVKEIHYSINMGAEQIVSSSTASFTLSDNGTHSISYFVVDNAGNSETAKLATVKIDKIAPITTLSRSAGLITLAATDAHSGVAKIKYQVNGGAVADYSVPFADTVHKVTYWAEDAAGNIEAANTNIINAGVHSISVTQARTTGGLGTIGTVTLDKAAGVGGTVINLASSLPGVAVVDQTITIPEDATTASFDIDANPVAIDTSVSITASIYETSQSALITVQAPMPVQISWSNSPVSGGTSTTGTLIISGPAPTGGTTVSLASSSLSALVPTTVTIPAGSMTTTFNVSTNVVSNDTSAVITAVVYGIKLKSTISILGPKVSSITLAASSVASLGTTTGTITLSSNAPVGGKVVTLSSSNASVASVPVSVTVPAGTRTATFTITAGTVNANTNATITAITNNSSGTATITVTPPAAVLSTLTTVVTAVTGGVPVTGTVTLTSAAPTGGAVVTLASSSTTIGTVPASVTVAAGATSATFTITTRTVTAASALTITATRNGVSKTATITVNPVRVVSTLTLNPTSVRGGTNSTGTVTLTGIATEAVVVTLTSGTTAVARVPTSVTVPAGSTTATFTITTLTQTATRTSIITARTGTTSRTATLSVTR